MGSFLTFAKNSFTDPWCLSFVITLKYTQELINCINLLMHKRKKLKIEAKHSYIFHTDHFHKPDSLSIPHILWSVWYISNIMVFLDKIKFKSPSSFQMRFFRLLEAPYDVRPLGICPGTDAIADRLYRNLIHCPSRSLQK